MVTKALIIIGIHIIGAIVTLIIFHKTGEFEAAAKQGNGIYSATPSDVVFMALVLWEILLFLYIITAIDSTINDFFYKKYVDGDRN